ncbi:circumsporozoite protein-like isoform X1 [Nycticebus coucang]|uniref:circumsporozoite protein-like isoform X1 n=1 Tax=Nycticebus coucang TaxID=9470 RepID=UPI00234DEF96|nr:circumsporozoite protein-like isoform X1 [Nycticebus coucang]
MAASGRSGLVGREKKAEASSLPPLGERRLPCPCGMGRESQLEEQRSADEDTEWPGERGTKGHTGWQPGLGSGTGDRGWGLGGWGRGGRSPGWGGDAGGGSQAERGRGRQPSPSSPAGAPRSSARRQDPAPGAGPVRCACGVNACACERFCFPGPRARCVEEGVPVGCELNSGREVAGPEIASPALR